MLNSRGQLNSFVNKSVEDNKRFETILSNYILKKYDIKIIKHPNPYKHYDFSYYLNKIEYKGLFYTLDNDNKQAIKNKKPNVIIKNVMISKHKIEYYKKRRKKNNDLKFFLIYRFYKTYSNIEFDKVEVEEIDYKFIDISDFDKFISNNPIRIIEKNEHYMIRIKDLEDLPENNLFIIE